MDNKEIKIRKALPQDAEEIQEVLYKTWLNTYPNENHGITKEDIEERYKNTFTDEAVNKMADEIANPPEGQLFLVAKDGDTVVALCRAVRSSKINRLRTIYILPEYQSKGIGKTLWIEALNHFDPNKDIVVDVISYNEKAIAFYKKLGFSETGKIFQDEKLKLKSGAIFPKTEMVIKRKI